LPTGILAAISFGAGMPVGTPIAQAQRHKLLQKSGKRFSLSLVLSALLEERIDDAEKPAAVVRVVR
jgi:hypothetical protein